jgi:hypothetical protein
VYNIIVLINHHTNHKKEPLQSRRFKERKRVKHVFVYSFFALIFGLFILFVSWVSRWSFMQIDTIQVIGVDASTTAMVRASALDALSGSYLGIFSRANTIFYPKKSIKENIASSSFLIKEIDIERDGMSSMLVTIKTKEPNVVLCTKLPDIEEMSNDSCYLADSNGFVFDELRESKEKIPKFYLGQSSTTNPVGTIPINIDRLKNLRKFYNGVVDSNISVAGMLIGDNNTELYIRNNIEKDNNSIAVVYINEKYSLDESLDNLISFWRYMHNQNKSISFSEIKLQFPPNIYYTESQ